MQGLGADALLLLISQIAGIILLLGTMLLVGFRRIYFDKETKQPIEIEIPLFGKVKTQAPAFALIVVAACLVMYPLSRSRPDLVTVQGDIDTGGKAVTVLVVAVPQYQATLDRAGAFHIPVPVLKDSTYRVKFIVDGRVVADQEATMNKGVFEVKPIGVAPEQTQSDSVATKKEVSDEELRKHGIY
jgi:hypothetical protein